MSIADIRKDYIKSSLVEVDVAKNPIDQFSKWWQEAINAHIDEVNAMTLATASAAGVPSARMVLLKQYDEKGFVFFTNYTSQKGRNIEENPFASLLFFWKELERQVRIVGSVQKLDVAASDIYYDSRPEGSKIGAWVSPQSQVISHRAELEERIEFYEDKFKSTPIQRPDYWGGYIVIPSSIEFWQGRSSRLHDRILYTKKEVNWDIQRLAP
jgi:pyridoxamine 5'-phosphate oxidase